jgi:hypothetical protein
MLATGYFPFTLKQQNILGLEITMRYSMRMRELQCCKCKKNECTLYIPTKEMLPKHTHDHWQQYWKLDALAAVSVPLLARAPIFTVGCGTQQQRR